MLIAALWAVPVQAQQTPCGQREQIVKMLGQRHAEKAISMGLALNGAVVEVFSTVDGTSWTLLMTMPDGRACLMAAGEAWMSTVPTKVVGEQS